MNTTNCRTNFPTHVQQSIGAGFVLVAKNGLDFEYCKLDLQGAKAHVEWFHSFWWVNNANTKTKLTAFYDTKVGAIAAGEQMCMGWDGHLYMWAVYNSAGVIQDGKY
jgi:hypothetical protein